MPLLRRFVVLLAAMALCAPGLAVAQSTTLAQEGAGVSTQPPVQLDGEDEEPATTPPPAAAAPRRTTPADALPNTGSDPRTLFLVGGAMMLFGVGLRLRTADAELY